MRRLIELIHFNGTYQKKFFTMIIPLQEILRFQNVIYDYYATHKRVFAWRKTTDPYLIFVSEVMLQQTQTTRVSIKYPEFIHAFPNFSALAKASSFEILKTWQGMGYNRRALALQKSAQIITNTFGGNLPEQPEELLKLPGIGKATAASIAAFAFNKPTIFIETNIRAVFIHYFFKDKVMVEDSEIFPLVEQTLDIQSPREWYYALMDYGVMLKAHGINPIAKSKQYRKQSKFDGSNRQIRGAAVKLLVNNNAEMDATKLIDALAHTYNTKQARVKNILLGLVEEKIIGQKNNSFLLSKN